MPINQRNVRTMIEGCGEPASTSGRKVWIMDGANMATAVNFFKLITGIEFNIFAARKIVEKEQRDRSGELRFEAFEKFYLSSHSEQIHGKKVTVTLRGGSSSQIEGPGARPDPSNHLRARYDVHDGPPTMEILNAEALTDVPQFRNLRKKTTVEVKFTTRTGRGQWAEYR